jgi:hypothetical protein
MSKGIFGRLEDELTARDKAAGLSAVDLLKLPEAQRRLVQWLMREGEMGSAAVVAHVGQDEATALATIRALVEQGFVRETVVRGEARYSTRLGSRRKRSVPLDVWAALTDKIRGVEGEQP